MHLIPYTFSRAVFFLSCLCLFLYYFVAIDDLGSQKKKALHMRMVLTDMVYVLCSRSERGEGWTLAGFRTSCSPPVIPKPGRSAFATDPKSEGAFFFPTCLKKKSATMQSN